MNVHTIASAIAVLLVSTASHAQTTTSASPAPAPAAAPAGASATTPPSAPAPADAVQARESGTPPQTGTIAYYGRKFTGRRTASGQRFDPNAMTMAHPTLAFGTRVRVTNTENGKSVVLRVNDRGPTSPGRIADVSLAAARELGMLKQGLVEAKLEVLSVMTSR